MAAMDGVRRAQRRLDLYALGFNGRRWVLPFDLSYANDAGLLKTMHNVMKSCQSS